MYHPTFDKTISNFKIYSVGVGTDMLTKVAIFLLFLLLSYAGKCQRYGHNKFLSMYYGKPMCATFAFGSYFKTVFDYDIEHIKNIIFC